MKSRSAITAAVLIVVCVAGFANAASYYTGFEDTNKPSYVVASVSFSNVVWTLDSVVSGSLAADKKEGVYSLRMAYSGVPGSVYTGSAYFAETLTGAFSTLSFKYAAYGTSSYLVDGRIAADISTDDGGTWNNVMETEVHSSDQDLTPTGTSFGPYNYVRLRFRFWDLTCTISRQRANIDTVELIPEPGSLLIAGSVAVGLLALLRRK